MIEVVVGDVHARADLLYGLLRRLRIVDSRGQRRPGYWVVQVGDLVDRNARPAANLSTARLAAGTLDLVLAGNHEAEMLAASRSANGAALATLAGRGWPQAAAAVSGWLVTHAGIHPELTLGMGPRAEDCVAEINDRWHQRSHDLIRDPLFDWVGRAKGGLAPYGGLFSRSEREWPPDGRTPWGQICGHAPQPRPRLLPGPRWLIDVGARGARLAALVCSEPGSGWSPFVIRLTTAGVICSPMPSKRLAA